MLPDRGYRLGYCTNFNYEYSTSGLDDRSCDPTYTYVQITARLKSKRCGCFVMGLFSRRDPEDLMYHAMLFIEKGQPKGAVALFGQILKQKPGHRDALYHKALALNQLKKYNDAVTCSDMILERHPLDVGAYNNKGRALAEMGDTGGAIECYDAAIKADPKYYESYFNKGVLLSRLQDHETALNLMKTATKLNSKNPVPLLHKGIILGKLHRNKEALSVLDALERKFGSHPDVTFQRGIQTAELGNHRQAIRIFEGIAQHQDNVNILYALTRSRAALGEYSVAMDLLKRSISKSPKMIRAWAREEDAFKPLYHNERFRKMVKM